VKRAFVGLFAFFALAACKTKSAPAQPPAAARFCDQNLSGLWVNSSDKRFAYRFTDQNGLVTGEYLQRAEDGGLTKPGDPVTFELRRSDTAITGVMKMTGEAPSGKVCPVEYEIRFSDCKPDSLQAVVETSAVIGEDCKRKMLEDGGQIPQDLTEFRFERAP
jgi:hypothetical protein